MYFPIIKNFSQFIRNYILLAEELFFMHFEFTIYIDVNIIRTIFVSRLQRANLVSLRAAQPHVRSSFISRKLQSYMKFIALVVNRRRAGRSKVQPGALCFKFLKEHREWKMMPVARRTWARALHKETGSVRREGGYRKLFPIKSAAEERGTILGNGFTESSRLSRRCINNVCI